MKSNEGISRRRFLAQTACGAGVLGSLTVFTANAADSRRNAFAYDVDKYAKTDPKLLGYEEIGRFSAANPEPRRIAYGNDQRLYVAGKNGVAAPSHLEPAIEWMLKLNRDASHAARAAGLRVPRTVMAG